MMQLSKVFGIVFFFSYKILLNFVVSVVKFFFICVFNQYDNGIDVYSIVCQFCRFISFISYLMFVDIYIFICGCY